MLSNGKECKDIYRTSLKHDYLIIIYVAMVLELMFWYQYGLTNFSNATNVIFRRKYLVTKFQNKLTKKALLTIFEYFYLYKLRR